MVGRRIRYCRPLRKQAVPRWPSRGCFRRYPDKKPQSSSAVAGVVKHVRTPEFHILKYMTCDSSMVSPSIRISTTSGGGSGRGGSDVHPLKRPSKSSIVTSDAVNVDANGCGSGARRRRATVMNCCAWPLGIRLLFPPRQSSFGYTPAAPVNSQPTNQTARNFTRERAVLSYNSRL